MSEVKFPTDSATLHMLIAACQINPDSGHTELMSFLNMGTREKSREVIDEGTEEGGWAGASVYEVEYEQGYEPFSPTHVIQTLAEELLALRTSHVPSEDE